MRALSMLLVAMLLLPVLGLEETVARWKAGDHEVELRVVEGKPDWKLSVFDGEDLVYLSLNTAQARRLSEGWEKAKARAFQLKPEQKDEAGDLAPVLAVTFTAYGDTDGTHSVLLLASDEDASAAALVKLDGPEADAAAFEALLLRAQRAP